MADAEKKNPTRLEPRGAQHGETSNSPESIPANGKPQGRFAKVASAAIFDARLSAEAVRVLAAFATYADAAGLCRPAVGTIADRLGVARRAVQKQMRKLEGAGYLSTIRTQRDKGGFGTNTYRIHFPTAERPENSSADDGSAPNQTDLADSGAPCASGHASPIALDASSEDTSPVRQSPMRPQRTHRTHADVSLEDTGGVSPEDTPLLSTEDALSDHLKQTNEQKGYPPTPLRGDIEVLSPFDEFIAASPKAQQRGLVRKAWDAALRSGASSAELIAGMRAHVAGTPQQFIERAENWLARKGWLQPVRHRSGNGSGFDPMRWAMGG